MTDRTPISSEEELSAELQTLLQLAHSGGVEVKGAWECRNGPEYPDWDVVVTEVAKPDNTD